MASDAHAHPFDLSRFDPNAETLRRTLGVACAASSWNLEELLYQERLAKDAAGSGGPRMALCFGAHPQLALSDVEAGRKAAEFVESLAAEKRITAVGEIGFDFYDDAYRGTAEEQERLFKAQLDVALRYSLPCVLHLRRAMEKAFEYSRQLSDLPAVVFHSYSGTAREADSILKRGVNAFFSFGSTVFLNHKRAMDACVSVDSDRLLTETDAPYQKPRGKEFSSWADLSDVIAAIARLRADAGRECSTAREVEEAADRNFRRVYGSL